MTRLTDYLFMRLASARIVYTMRRGRCTSALLPHTCRGDNQDQNAWNASRKQYTLQSRGRDRDLHGYWTSPTRGSVTSLGLRAREDVILQAIARLQFVTAQQIVGLFYRAGSLEYVRGRLKLLADHGYLLRLRLPSAGPGNTPWVHALASKGWRYLRTSGVLSDQDDGGLRFRPVEHREHSWLFLTHSLSVTDVLVAALILPKIQPDLVLWDLLHERVLRRQPPIKVTTLRGESIHVIPDGFLDFVIRDKARMSIVLELDRGTMEQEAMQRKFRGLLAYADGPYQTAFHSNSLTYAIATTAGTRRCEQLRSWCERVLREVPDVAQRQAYAALFLFKALPPSAPGSGMLDPDDLFLQPVWSQLLVDGLVPLLDLPLPSFSTPSIPSTPSP